MAYPLAAPFIGYSDAVFTSVDRCDMQIYVTGRECEKYPAKQHAQRVAARLGAANGLIYLAGQPTINLEDSDQSRPFRQRRYFYYITGVNEPDCHVTYDVRADLLTLYVPDFNLRRAIWMGPTLTVDEALRKYDVDRVRYFSSLRSDIERWADKQAQRGITSPIYILHPLHKPTVAASKPVPLDDERLLPAMDAARGVKDAHEIDLIRQANHVSGMAHRSVLEQIHRMSNEAEIHGLFLDTCVSQGARNQAYEIIAASGENAAVLHYQKNNDDLDGRQMVCLDAGAEWECYASDVTRTFPLAGEWPSAEAQNIYSVVERMQEECIQGIRPGARFLDLHLLAHKIAIEELMALGILRGGSIEEIRRSGASTIFFPHGLGHHVGLEVHDVSETSIMGLNASADDAEDDIYDSVLMSETTRPPCTRSSPLLQEGMVVTVEPGIYFSRYALGNARSSPLAKFIDFDVAERYIPIGGVRIEDDILVTAHGYENLTTAPKGDRMLQIIRTGSDL